MNKIKKIIWIFVLLLFPINVHALTGNISVTCDKTEAQAGDTVKCAIAGSSDVIVSAIQGKAVITSENVSITAFTKSDSWGTGTFDNNIFNVSTENSTIKDNFTVGELSLKVADSATAGAISLAIQDIEFKDSDGTKVTEGITTAPVTFNIVATPTPVAKGLKALGVSHGGTLISLSDDNSGIIQLASSDTTTFGINAVPNNDSDAVVCKDSSDLDKAIDCSNIEFIGNPTMNIQIFVGTGDNQVIYTLNVIKPVSIGEPELLSLTVGGKNVPLYSGKTDGYEVVLDNVNSYQVSFTLKDSDNYEVTNLTNPTIRSGEGEFAITIEPKDKSSGLKSATYIIQVTKAGGTVTPTEPVNNNPKTGGGAAAVMAIVLFLSFAATIFLYQRNLKGYN